MRHLSSWGPQGIYRLDDYTWDLTSPKELVQCFYYLLALRHRLQAEVKEDFAAFDKKKIETVECRKLRANWRYSPSQERKNDGRDGEPASKIQKVDHCSSASSDEEDLHPVRRIMDVVLDYL